MWEPQPGNQTSAFLAAWIDELFYGGERGGGKSDFQLGYQQDGALRYGSAHKGIMFRKTYTELEELQSRAMEIFTSSGAVYKTQPSAQFPYSNSWYWPNGASVKMRYLEHERDYGRQHGQQYSSVSLDEVTEYASPFGMLKMLSTLRSPHGVPCTLRATGNPGGVGHGWVKQRYIDGRRPFVPYKDQDSGLYRMFIPSRTQDNKILMRNDPGYRNRIKASTGGNEALRKAWLEGDWDIVAGAFFDVWNKNRHIIRPFDIPANWLRFRSMDWGSAKPFSVGWWAIVQDDYVADNGITLPRGCLVRYREWYGMARDEYGLPKYNTGLKMVAEEVGHGIREREYNDPAVSYGVLDPAAFSHDGGPSIYERIHNGSGKTVNFRRADNKRVAKAGAMGGWDQMRSRLIGEAEDRPMIVCFSTCEDSIRTIPLMQHDKDNVEDVDTDQEDHCFAAGTMIITDKGKIPIEQLPEEGIVLSIDGYVPYRSARMVSPADNLVELTFSDGTKVKCTPDHKFLLTNDLWIRADRLIDANIRNVFGNVGKCVSVVALKEKEPVYCITVPSSGCFAIGNGMIVANCPDEWRYACMSRPYTPAVQADEKPKFWEDLTLNELWNECQTRRHQRI